MELHEDSAGAVENARFLALASDIAYYPLDQAALMFREQLGMESKLFSVGNSQAYVLTNAEHIVVAFRGTETPTSIDGLRDWLLTDALNLLIVPEGRMGTDLAAAGVAARFHQGFVNALTDLWELVFDDVSAEMKRSERPLWLTGHSLGGALALLAAWMFTRRFVPVHQVYTFGAPRIGNAATAEAFGKALPNKVFRYVNGPDPIPTLPTVSLIANDYSHCEREMGVGQAVDLAFVQGLAASAVNGVLTASLREQLWSFVKERLGAHAMANYLELIRGNKS